MRQYLLLLLISLFFITCKKDENNGVMKNINGVVQKGPFTAGSTVVLNELDGNLNQTGRSFTTTISDNAGNFSFTGIELISDFVQLAVEGFYFNEVTGRISESRINLFAVTNVANRSSVNVNVLTHLSKARIENLVREGNLGFEAARTQSLNEILESFSISNQNLTPEDLNLLGNDTGANILIAISSILLNNKSDGEFVEFLANYSNDLANNGDIDTESITSRIRDDQRGLHLIDHLFPNSTSTIERIRQNIINRYRALGITVVVGDFGSFIYNSGQIAAQEYSFNTTSNINKADSLYYSNPIIIKLDDTVIANSLTGNSTYYVFKFNGTITQNQNYQRLISANGILQNIDEPLFFPGIDNGVLISEQRLVLRNGLSVAFFTQNDSPVISQSVIDRFNSNFVCTECNQISTHILTKNGEIVDLPNVFREGDTIRLLVNPYLNRFFFNNDGSVITDIISRVSQYNPFSISGNDIIPDGVFAQARTITTGIYIDGRLVEFTLNTNAGIGL